MIIYFGHLHFTHLPPLHVLSVLSMSEIGFQKKNWIGGGGVGGCWMSGIVLTLQGPLRIVLFSFVLYCIIIVCTVNVYYI